ncbi:MAG TPA: hypothetical protein VMT82_08545 [candidate division Zixibacteria bacterium]|nr:hypothetical protein [candidate division Zixibacteria bacterium]
MAQADQPNVRVNMLNVCSPSAADRAEIARALSHIPQPAFTQEYEVARGRSSSAGADLALAGGSNTAQSTSFSDWVRIRREFADKSPLLNAQYSFSVSDKQVNETLVLRMRDPKEVMQVSISDAVTAGSPAQVAAANTPADRIRLERFGKSSIVLSRCEQVDQSAFQGLFTTASTLLNTYRKSLRVARLVPEELVRMPGIAPEDLQRMGEAKKTPAKSGKK